MINLHQVRAAWDLLQTLHPLFLYAGSLPTIEDAEKRHSRQASSEEMEHLKNEITMLRNDLKLNIVKQQQVDFDQPTEDESLLQALQSDLSFILAELENLVDARIVEGRVAELRRVLSLYPVLRARLTNSSLYYSLNMRLKPSRDFLGSLSCEDCFRAPQTHR